MKILEKFIVAYCLASAVIVAGCDDPVDEGSAISGAMQPYNNHYFDYNEISPEYIPVVYRVRHYEPSKETEYFTRSLKKIAEGRSIHGQPPGKIRYYVIQIKDSAAHTSRETYVASYKAARIFSLKDIIAHEKDLEALVRQTAPEPPPFLEDPAQPGPRYGQGGLLIIRHIGARRNNGEQPVMHPPRPRPVTGPAFPAEE